jgi:hypothetical protein
MTILIIRMTVVPGDEFRRGMAAWKILAWNAEPAIGFGAAAENQRPTVTLPR